MSVEFQDNFFVKKLAEPAQAYRDVLDSHKLITGLRDAATEPIRVNNLQQERKRLAGIAWDMKRYWHL